MQKSMVWILVPWRERNQCTTLIRSSSVSNYRPEELQAFNWGLIPSWAKTGAEAISEGASNAVVEGENIFKKPSLKGLAANQRCIVIVDAFYLRFNHPSRVKIPYRLSLADSTPMALAGIWSSWIHPIEGNLINSLSIVTTTANGLLSRIQGSHSDPRMPVILNEDKAEVWLSDDFEKETMEHILIPYPDQELQYRTVKKLGIKGTGNTPEAAHFHKYQLDGLV